jgi:alanine racemase
MPNETSFAGRAWVEIDLAALERNLGKIKAALPAHIRYVAVVKADAYGHGVGPTVSRLLQCGVDCFAVANVCEGTEIREIGPGADILVLGPVLPEELPKLADYDLTAALSTPEEAHALAALAAARRCRLRVHVKVDTGMGRMGVWHADAAALFETVLALPALDLCGAFTHFSSADSDAAFTEHQRTLFLKTLEALPPAARSRMLIHADNSAGLETFSPSSPFNAVRVGLLQYGFPPHQSSLLARLRPEAVLSFHSKIGLLKTLPAGTPISYNRTYTLTRDTRIALVTAGYGDGIPLSASNRAQVLIRGKRCPVLGRVTMDQTIVDVTDHPDVAVGDIVTLIGVQQNGAVTISEFCEWTGTIPWEVLCSISKRVVRVSRTLRIQ